MSRCATEILVRRFVDFANNWRRLPTRGVFRDHNRVPLLKLPPDLDREEASDDLSVALRYMIQSRWESDADINTRGVAFSLWSPHIDGPPCRLVPTPRDSLAFADHVIVLLRTNATRSGVALSEFVGVCDQCNKLRYKPTRHRSRFCSATCRAAWHRRARGRAYKPAPLA